MPQNIYFLCIIAFDYHVLQIGIQRKDLVVLVTQERAQWKHFASYSYQTKSITIISGTLKISKHRLNKLCLVKILIQIFYFMPESFLPILPILPAYP